MAKTYNEITEIINTSFTLESFFPSTLSDESSFFRFKIKDTDITFKLHYFHDFNENDVDDIECILHIYIGTNKAASHYGRFEQLLIIMNKSIND